MSPAIRMVVCGVLLAAASVACGGQVEEEKTPDEQGSDPDKSEQTKEPATGSGSGGGALPGGGAGAGCAGTTPHPAYPYCYETSYPPCLSVQSVELPGRIAQSVSLGPWVGVNSNCKMLCCYGP